MEIPKKRQCSDCYRCGVGSQNNEHFEVQITDHSPDAGIEEYRGTGFGIAFAPSSGLDGVGTAYEASRKRQSSVDRNCQQEWCKV